MQERLELFGFNLRRELKARRLSSTTVAELLGVSKVYLSMLLRGKRAPSFEMILNIEKALKIEPYRLWAHLPKTNQNLDRLMFIASVLPPDLLESLTEIAESLFKNIKKKESAKK